MLIFANTATPAEVVDLLSVAMVDGVTMNPSLVAAAGNLRVHDVLPEMLQAIPGRPIFAQVTSMTLDEMVREGRSLREISDRIIVKLPCTTSGFSACRRLSEQNVPVNMTLCFTPTQALLAAKAGAQWVSPFVGRLDDAGRDGSGTLRAICDSLRDYGFLSSTRVLAASIRSPIHFAAALSARAHAVTLSPSQVRDLPQDPLTEEGCAAFASDWSTAMGDADRGGELGCRSTAVPAGSPHE